MIGKRAASPPCLSSTSRSRESPSNSQASVPPQRAIGPDGLRKEYSTPRNTATVAPLCGKKAIVGMCEKFAAAFRLAESIVGAMANATALLFSLSFFSLACFFSLHGLHTQYPSYSISPSCVVTLA